MVGYQPVAAAEWSSAPELFDLTVVDEHGVRVGSELGSDCSSGICQYVPRTIATLYANTAIEVVWTMLNSSLASTHGFVQWLSQEEPYNGSNTTFWSAYPYPENVCEATGNVANPARVNLSLSIFGEDYVSEDGYQYSLNEATGELYWSVAEPIDKPRDKEMSSTINITAPSAAGLYHLVWYDYSPCEEESGIAVKYDCLAVSLPLEQPAGDVVEQCLRVRTSLVALVKAPEPTVDVQGEASMNFAVTDQTFRTVAEHMADISGHFPVSVLSTHQVLTFEVSVQNQYQPSGDQSFLASALEYAL
jgi:hypothetical protein